MQEAMHGDAALVYDGQYVHLPNSMVPRDDQAQGTPAEVLAEVVGRVCYDSFGVGRSSDDYHRHILSVGHLNVHEHFNATIRVATPHRGREVALTVLRNRPGVWVRTEMGGGLRLTLNTRSVLEWARWTSDDVSYEEAVYARALGDAIRCIFHKRAPRVVPPPKPPVVPEETQRVLQNLRERFGLDLCADDGDDPLCTRPAVHSVEPEHDEERWVSLYLTGSRGWSHEQVRHRYRSAVSQRSTRYVDEAKARWVAHPLIARLRSDADDNRGAAQRVTSVIAEATAAGQKAYRTIADVGEAYLTYRGVPKATARKQARGAARGYLGNALETAMVFSASVAQWKHILALRAHDAADAEIRHVAMDNVLLLLRACRYRDRFADIERRPSSDGLGWCIADPER